MKTNQWKIMITALLNKAPYVLKNSLICVRYLLRDVISLYSVW